MKATATLSFELSSWESEICTATPKIITRSSFSYSCVQLPQQVGTHPQRITRRRHHHKANQTSVGHGLLCDPETVSLQGLFINTAPPIFKRLLLPSPCNLVVPRVTLVLSSRTSPTSRPSTCCCVRCLTMTCQSAGNTSKRCCRAAVVLVCGNKVTEHLAPIAPV